MRMIVVTAGTLMLGLLCPAPAGAWSSANRYGGSTSHTEGETSHTNAYGGSSSHAAGEGTEHTNTYGGSSAHAYGGGSEHTNAYGGSTSGAYGEGATHTYAGGASVYHPPGSAGYGGYPAYHPPVAVPYYSANGCNGCAVAAGAIVGVAAGAAVGAAASAAAHPAPVAYAALPAGCAWQPTVQKYFCGGTWFAPMYGANGVYYQVVPPP